MLDGFVTDMCQKHGVKPYALCTHEYMFSFELWDQPPGSPFKWSLEQFGQLALANKSSGPNDAYVGLQLFGPLAAVPAALDLDTATEFAGIRVRPEYRDYVESRR